MPSAADTDDNPADGRKPAQTSLSALRGDGEAVFALDFAAALRATELLATELLNTVCEPLRVTPAVRPSTRAANCEGTDGLTDRAPTLPVLGVRPSLLDGAVERAAPEVVPLDTPPLEEVGEEGAEGELGAGAGETPEPEPVAPPAGEGGLGDGSGGALPRDGTPVSGGTHAHATLILVTVAASTARTVRTGRRCRSIRSPLSRWATLQATPSTRKPVPLTPRDRDPKSNRLTTKVLYSVRSVNSRYGRICLT